MKYIITESQNENLKVLLKQVIKSKGVLMAIKTVGINNFMKIMNINSPMDYLHLFDHLDIVESKESPNIRLFRYRPGHNLMVYDRELKVVHINYYDIWEILKDIFVLIDFEINKLIKEWLSEVYNLRGVTINDTQYNSEV